MLLRTLDERMLVSGQIHPSNLEEVKAEGVTMIVNNRPDDEEPGQPSAAEIEAAARAAGIAYRHIPVGSSGLSANQVQAMVEAVDEAPGKMLAFCRSGTRSTYLWALARVRKGDDPGEIVGKAAEAGYDLTPIRPYLG
ncbi:TIGR01244 family sulfur transferase [Sphingosinicella humi]|uniref:TIGR01244 family phosphatase n=1 Tax=Allosphingosinicella humi TaxID=2068657 RepID=A0A2U2J2H9_9SPHN|nr:TIGR01244 family sulfur transferase [Sphingosinicella humi]PWG02546.1 TIGR01244 family phosphatase [Sphingosinicella humi]